MDIFDFVLFTGRKNKRKKDDKTKKLKLKESPHRIVFRNTSHCVVSAYMLVEIRGMYMRPRIMSLRLTFVLTMPYHLLHTNASSLEHGE